MSDPSAESSRHDVLQASTRPLLRRARRGDARALDELCARYLRRLMRWATGRLPAHARSLVDTGDLVQEALINAIGRIDAITTDSPEAFPAYLRTAVLNRLRDEVRHRAVQPRFSPLTESQADRGPTPLEETIGRDLAHRYELAMERLRDAERSAIFLRIEMGLSYRDIARAMDKPSAEAARQAVHRALLRLAEEFET